MANDDDFPLLEQVRLASFEPLGWFVPDGGDGVPMLAGRRPARFCLLIGNAGPAMYARFAAERGAPAGGMDVWTRDVLAPLADKMGAHAVFPFDKPPLPFLTWARRAGCGHVSPLGLNIHARFGLWHAFRAAFLFDRVIDLPTVTTTDHPCETCVDRPCLNTCPIGAFTAGGYAVEQCRSYVANSNGADCAGFGCKARLACPVGSDYHYAPEQARFHMSAFARSATISG